jgi:hypothetical protein
MRLYSQIIKEKIKIHVSHEEAVPREKQYVPREKQYLERGST